MDTYRRQFPVQTVCGDSIIRDYVSLDHDFSILEQDISICIYENGRGWIGEIGSTLPVEVLLTVE